MPWPIPPRPRPVYPVYPGYPSYPDYPGYPGYPVVDTVKDLLLTVEKTGDPRYTSRSVQLGCAPLSGTHPDAGGACAVLTPAQGDPARIAPSWTVCAQVQDPVRATATGIWNGRYIQFERTYSNPCAMHRATGTVFSF
ncbi:SSI family serine proteinase inhibitor [Streptosporangium canum]|uniref:SSI family serine proteinase inhibitor n=1 Tax=Streptosporangium canum TaxID=324952 RepID=UPI0037A1AFEA